MCTPAENLASLLSVATHWLSTHTPAIWLTKTLTVWRDTFNGGSSAHLTGCRALLSAPEAPAPAHMLALSVDARGSHTKRATRNRWGRAGVDTLDTTLVKSTVKPLNKANPVDKVTIMYW